MRRALATLALASALPFALHAYTPAFSHGGYFPAEGSPRAVSSLNVGWDFARGDGFKARVNLPHTLNVVDFQASGGSNYQGPATYEKRFAFTPKGARQFLHFEAIMGKSEIVLNGEKIGARFGGYHPIHIEVTGKLKPTGNVLRVTCDNADDPDYPPGKPQTQLDFAYFGGIYRDVWLIETGPVAVSAPGPQEGARGNGRLPPRSPSTAKAPSAASTKAKRFPRPSPSRSPPSGPPTPPPSTSSASRLSPPTAPSPTP